MKNSGRLRNSQSVWGTALSSGSCYQDTSTVNTCWETQNQTVNDGCKDWAVFHSSVLTACAPILGTDGQKSQVVWFRHCSLGWKQPSPCPVFPFSLHSYWLLCYFLDWKHFRTRRPLENFDFLSLISWVRKLRLREVGLTCSSSLVMLVSLPGSRTYVSWLPCQDSTLSMILPESRRNRPYNIGIFLVH